MKILENYIGIESFTVKIDSSKELEELVVKARELRGLDFSSKLDSVKKLTIDAMVNAYEIMVEGENAEERAKGNKIVHNSNYPLSHALKEKAGCCRYQGALFFVLGYEANLGDKHFIQAARVRSGANSVFNEVISNGESHLVKIFGDSLKNKKLDYNYREVWNSLNGFKFYSYHRTPNRLIIIENPNTHIRNL